MSALEIRLAQPTEYDEVDQLILEAYSHDYGTKSGGADDPMRAAANRAQQFDVWVAHDSAGRLLGSVTTRRSGEPSLHEGIADDELDLRLLAVSPLARRQGIGAEVMRWVIAHADREGFAAVYLKTAPNMTGAHKLYESLGFVRTPDRDGLWIGGKKVLDLFSYVYPLHQARFTR